MNKLLVLLPAVLLLLVPSLFAVGEWVGGEGYCNICGSVDSTCEGPCLDGSCDTTANK